MNQREDVPTTQPTFVTQTEWRPGPRNPSWDALWDQIIADLGQELAQAVADGEIEPSASTDSGRAMRAADEV